MEEERVRVEGRGVRIGLKKRLRMPFANKDPLIMLPRKINQARD